MAPGENSDEHITCCYHFTVNKLITVITSVDPPVVTVFPCVQLIKSAFDSLGYLPITIPNVKQSTSGPHLVRRSVGERKQNLWLIAFLLSPQAGVILSILCLKDPTSMDKKRFETAQDRSTRQCICLVPPWEEVSDLLLDVHIAFRRGGKVNDMTCVRFVVLP